MSSKDGNRDDGAALPRLPVSCEMWDELRTKLGLTPQQDRVVELILRGMQDKEIAASLRLKVPTVRSHVKKTFERLKVGNRIELVLKLFAASHDIKPPTHH